MFIADGLVFLELQKTGGSHICRLLAEYANGRAMGKHNRPGDDQRRLLASRHVIGSVRNPWDWYVSLWAFGVGGKGAIRNRTSKRFDIDYYRNMLPRAMGKKVLSPRERLVSVGHDLLKPVSQWQAVYRDADDAEQFRRWLFLVLNGKNRHDIGEGYAFSPLSRHAGLMTYRYLRLFTLGDALFHDRRLATLRGLDEFDREKNIVQSMIRNETLEEDFIRALQAAGVALDESQQTAIRQGKSGKTNTSRRKPASYYYDPQSIQLVADREAWLIEKYHYSPPAE